MVSATLKINNSLLSRILRIFDHINTEILCSFSNEIEMKAIDKSHSNFLSAKLNENSYEDYQKSENFEILFDLDILKQVSEKSKVKEVSIEFSNSMIKFSEEDPMGSVFELNVYSAETVVNKISKFHVKNRIDTDSTQILDGLKKLSVISKFFDIKNNDGTVLFHSQDAVYGEGIFTIGNAQGFSSNTDYYHISPLRDILENVPDKTTVIIEMNEQHYLKFIFNFMNVSFDILIAASVSPA
jgi:hypothetical protein